MDIALWRSWIEALMTQSDIVGDHLYQTGHIEQVLAFEYVPEGQEWAGVSRHLPRDERRHADASPWLVGSAVYDVPQAALRG